jgi:hypothetical protein
MFNSIYSATVTPVQLLIMAAAALASGILFGWLMSFRIRANRRFFIVTSVMPLVVGLVLTFINGNIGAGIAFGGAFALTRFRSAQGTSDEITAVLIAMAAGCAFGMGYAAYGVLILVGLGLVFLGLSGSKLFDHAGMGREKLLNITIPESLDYTRAFEEPFARYLEQAESVGVKTTGMGSMYRLSFKIRMKNPAEEKKLIDELRTRNSNLEIAVLPYAEPQLQL